MQFGKQGFAKLHRLSVKGLQVVVVVGRRRERREERVGAINREIKRDGAGITQRLIAG